MVIHGKPGPLRDAKIFTLQYSATRSKSGQTPKVWQTPQSPLLLTEKNGLCLRHNGQITTCVILNFTTFTFVRHRHVNIENSFQLSKTKSYKPNFHVRQ